MSVTRKKLARGTVLQPSHVAAPVAQAISELTNATVSGDQLKAPRAPWAISLHTPVLDGMFFNGARYRIAENASPSWSVPFVVPPTQEHFNGGVVNESTPDKVIDTISFSFDTRAEAGAIRGQGYGFDYTLLNGDHPLNKTSLYTQGQIDFTEVDRLGLRLAILSKPQAEYPPSANWPYRAADPKLDTRRIAFRPTDEVWSADVPAVNFASAKERLNPLVFSGLNIPLHPFRTYLFCIFAADLDDYSSTAGLHLCLPSVLIRISGTSPLLARDAVVQNGLDALGVIPRGATPTFYGDAPVAGNEIIADGTKGLNTLLMPIDYALRSGLPAGKGDHAQDSPGNGWSWPAGSVVEDDCAWEVIAVPMWQGQAQQQFDGGFDGGADVGTAKLVARTGAAFPWGPGPVTDRRIIPIAYPFVVHHVVAALNLQNHSVNGKGQVAADGGPNGDIQHVIGCGVGSGIRSDHTAYTQFAHAEIVSDDASATWKDQLIDRISPPLQTDGSGNPHRPSWDLYKVQLLVRDGDADGSGYTVGGAQQGKPFLCARGFGWTNQRSEVADPPGSLGSRVAPTLGAEQFIEVRWEISLLGGAEFGTLGAGGGARVTLSGYGGSWVYLIGKKFLV